MDKGTTRLLVKLLLGTVIGSVYAGGTLFFMNNFYFGTKIGSLNIGGYNVAAASESLATKGENVNLVLYGKGVQKEVLSGKDFRLQYAIKEELQDLKDKQNPFLWPLALFKNGDLGLQEEITYDEQLLIQQIEGLSYFEEKNIIAPVDAIVAFNGESYDILPESEGRKLDEEKTKAMIIEAFKHNKTAIDLEKEGCYEVPKYTKDSPELIASKDKLNQLLTNNITYVFGDKREKVTSQMMSEWYTLDENGNVAVKEELVANYIDKLAEQYDTLGVTRTFRTSDQTTVTVSGGDYGWSIARQEETKALVEALKLGASIEREPICNRYGAQSFISTDLGNSYVEISLTKQYLWFYKDGKLITKGGIVTGDKQRGYSTPQGTYKLDYKQRNATLRGPGYATPVSFWMPFNGGIGIHDAVWRSRFGGNIYISNGSHGCVNAPYSMAQAIYNHIDATMPIICYY